MIWEYDSRCVPCEGDTPGVLYGCENTGVAGKGICKVMKTKGDKNR
jgi:hypothetical protein